MKYPLSIVTGAPGSGKSTILKAFLKLHSNYLAFDIDWLAETASGLAGKDIYTDPSTWKPYAALWFDVLYSVFKNGHILVFFTPNHPHDFEQFGRPAWISELKWLLLDCEDQTRRERLLHRADWTETMIDEAIVDARRLRKAIPLQINTGLLSPEASAAKILGWLEQVYRINNNDGVH